MPLLDGLCAIKCFCNIANINFTFVHIMKLLYTYKHRGIVAGKWPCAIVLPPAHAA
jgi:hypothetical protein